MTRFYPEEHQLLLEVADDVPDPDPETSFVMTVPLSVQVGSDTFDIGQALVTLDKPTLLGRTALEDRVVLALTTTDRSVRYRQVDR